MCSRIPSAVWFAALFAVATSAAQAPGTALCDGIATQIRDNREIASGASKDGLLSLLSKGDPTHFELASQSDLKFPSGGDSEQAEFVKRFRDKFDPSDELVEALNDSLGVDGNAEVFSLPDSDLHLVESFGGSANCESFTFFRTAKGGKSELLPGVPPKGQSDGDNVICDGFHDDGYLARLGGTDAFLEFMSGEGDNNFKLRVVPLQQSRWAGACSLEANFRTDYIVAKVFVPNGGSVTAAALGAVAAQIVEQHAAANNPKSFAFGPPVPDSEKENIRTMSDLASKLSNASVPAFGAERELNVDQASFPFGGADSYPLVLGAQTYLMSVGHAGIGFRVFPDSILVLHTLKDGNLEPVGSAIVGQRRGALQSLRVTVSR